MKKLTQGEFIERCNQVHNFKYDYSKTIYVNRREKIIIICPIHGSFEQNASDHLFGYGCRKCSNSQISQRQTYTTGQFIEKAKLIHYDKYDYQYVRYVDAKTKVEIYCNICNKAFVQSPKHHLRGHGCKYCKEKKTGDIKRLDKEEFINRANITHGNKFNYDKTEYKSIDKKITVTCNIHGDFSLIARKHILGQGCPKCSKRSNGELKIMSYLDNKKILYKKEKAFEDFRYQKTNGTPKFDFYLPEYNTCIEFDGVQHYIPTSFSSNQTEEIKQENLKNVKLRDMAKTQYCKEKGIKLIRIPYWKIKNIEEILDAHLNGIESV